MDTFRDRLKNLYGKSDLELTDKYNEMFGTSLSSPLSEMRLHQLANALSAGVR